MQSSAPARAVQGDGAVKDASPARVLRPSSKQSRVASPTRTTTTSPSKPSTASRPSHSSSASSSSPSPSSLTKDRLRANLEYYKFLTRVQSLLITTAESTPSTLHRAALVLRPCDYQEIVSERSNSSVCALPTCAHPTQRSSGRYRLSLSQRRVWDVTEEVVYCSRACEEQSLDFLAQLQEDPVYLRRFGDLLQSQPQPQPYTEQGRVVEALHALPAISAPTAPASSSTTASLPPDAEAPELVIRENASTPVRPPVAVAGAASTIEGYNRPAADTAQLKPKKRTPLPRASSRSAPVSYLVPNSADDAANSALSRPLNSDSDALSTDELDVIADIALQESAKRNVRMNPVQDTQSEAADEEEVNELQSDAEARRNMAAFRKARMLSPFAEVLSLVTHWVGEDTVALLTAKGRLGDVPPSTADDVRRRQEALAVILHRELRALAGSLRLSPLPVVQEQVDALALTFLANEPVPALASAQWQLILIVLLLALQRSHKAEGWTLPPTDLLTAANHRGYDAAQAEALMDILVPAPPPFPVHPPSLSTLPREVVSSVLTYLQHDELVTASSLSSLLAQVAYPLISSDIPQLAHHSAQVTGRMHTLGYRDGVSLGREILTQQGFDSALPRAYARTVQREAVPGVLAALAMWSSRGGERGDDELWVRCMELHGRVMRRPRGTGEIAVEDRESDTAGSEATRLSVEEVCVQRLEQAGVDAQALVAELKNGLDPIPDAVDEDVDALIAQHLQRSSALASQHSQPS